MNFYNGLEGIGFAWWDPPRMQLLIIGPSTMEPVQ